MTKTTDPAVQADSESQMIMNSISDLACKLGVLQTMDERLKKLEERKDKDISPALTANAKSVLDLQKEMGELKTAVAKMGSDVTTQAGTAITALQGRVDVIVEKAKAMESAVSGFEAQLGRLNGLSVRIDEPTRAALEKEVNRSHEKLLGLIREDAKLAIAEAFKAHTMSMSGRIDDIAREAFGEASKKLSRKVDELGDEGNGVMPFLLGAGAIAALYVAWKFKQAMDTETPDKYSVKGGPGTQLLDAKGNVIGQIA